MKTVLHVMMVALVGCAAAAQSVDWKDCKAVSNNAYAQVESFNAQHAKLGDGLRIEVSCLYSNPSPRKATQHIPLTVAEAKRLAVLRRRSYIAYDQRTAYEEHLLRAHGIKKPSFSDKCWYFVGFVGDDDFITIDTNTSFGECASRSPEPPQGE